MPVPDPVRLYRLTHIDNLKLLLTRGALHAPNSAPADGMQYHTIHDPSIQAFRHERKISCGPRGFVHDYLPFYLGPLSPMLYRLHKGGVDDYSEGQEPLIYLIAWADEIAESGKDFVFSDGHGIAAFTQWFDDLADLEKLDWPLILGKEWYDTLDDNDRKRRKQAEFLVHGDLPWSMIKGIAAINHEVAARVQEELKQFPDQYKPPVRVIPQWYYQG
ncbi:MAG: type II toxin-antitoxin system toxin DNA ADP-ribosyl transferase DarT [Endozoicomonas sp.]|uniref:type II toxin-antitoxin system toxin DNA ADP-ribosyl transferase DarT n=1 Tax=Endozoicomonas sp. TaxID=1892382 RepID=UPI003D9BAD08